jgi:hypothetical protein
LDLDQRAVDGEALIAPTLFAASLAQHRFEKFLRDHAAQQPLAILAEKSTLPTPAHSNCARRTSESPGADRPDPAARAAAFPERWSIVVEGIERALSRARAAFGGRSG